MLNKTYEIIFEDGSGKKIYRGKIHGYLGMTLDFSEPGEVKIAMIPYIEDILKDLTKKYDTMKTSATPSSDHLFKTR